MTKFIEQAHEPQRLDTKRHAIGRAAEHAPGTYGAYLDDLITEMKRRPALLYLAHYLRNYGRESLFPNYTPRSARAPNVKAIHASGCDWTWHQRQWDYREHARGIIEGREPWPHRLLPWKTWHEMRYYHGATGRMPAWLDPRNWPDPKRPPEYGEADLIADAIRAARARPRRSASQ